MFGTPIDSHRAAADAGGNGAMSREGDGMGERLLDDLATGTQGKPAHSFWSKPNIRGFDGWGDRFYDYWKAYGLALINGIPQVQQDTMLKNIGLPHVAKWLQGTTFQIGMQTLGTALPGHGILYTDRYNHQMLAEDSKGEVRSVDYAQLYTLFPPVTEEDPQAESRWPKLVLTSHHARGGSLKDMTSITHGIESLMKQCFKTNGHEKHFAPLEFETGDLWHPERTGKPNAQKLMIAYACDVDKNPFLNGAAMLRRVNELETHAGRNPKNSARNPDMYRDASQSAFRLAKVMLQCLVTEPERIDPNFAGFSLKQPGLSSAPLYIRPDAALVAQHLALIGYSKGGNVVSDAMRILVDELDQKRPDGSSLFFTPENGRFEHAAGAYVGYSPIHSMATAQNPLQGVKNIVRHIPLLSLASIEVPLSERMHLAGVRRVSVNNRFDFISGHTQLRQSKGNDEVIWVDGTRDLLGHAPADALGDKTHKGYILEDPHARRRIEEYFCALYGAAAVSNLQFHYDDKFESENRIAVIPAAGTSDKKILQHCSTIEHYLKEAGFTGVQVGPTEWNPSQILITVNEPLFLSQKHKVPSGSLRNLDADAVALKSLTAQGTIVEENVQKLMEAFREIRAHEPDLVINQAIDDDIDAHYRRMVDREAEYRADTAQEEPGKFSRAARASRPGKVGREA